MTEWVTILPKWVLLPLLHRVHLLLHLRRSMLSIRQRISLTLHGSFIQWIRRIHFCTCTVRHLIWFYRSRFFVNPLNQLETRAWSGGDSSVAQFSFVLSSTPAIVCKNCVTNPRLWRAKHMKHLESSSSWVSSSSFGCWLPRIDDYWNWAMIVLVSWLPFASWAFRDVMITSARWIMNGLLLCRICNFLLSRVSDAFRTIFHLTCVLPEILHKDSAQFYDLLQALQAIRPMSLAMVFNLSSLTVFWQAPYFVCRLHSAPFHRAQILSFSCHSQVEQSIATTRY